MLIMDYEDNIYEIMDQESVGLFYITMYENKFIIMY